MPLAVPDRRGVAGATLCSAQRLVDPSVAQDEIAEFVYRRDGAMKHRTTGGTLAGALQLKKYAAVARPNISERHEAVERCGVRRGHVGPKGQVAATYVTRARQASSEGMSVGRGHVSERRFAVLMPARLHLAAIENAQDCLTAAPHFEVNGVDVPLLAVLAKQDQVCALVVGRPSALECVAGGRSVRLKHVELSARRLDRPRTHDAVCHRARLRQQHGDKRNHQ
jgi:hypothetical protein